MADQDLTPQSEAPAIDEATSELFAPAPSSTPAAPYTVLARKYRPKSFDELIGQEGMVRTLKNAFASGRIAHAFMLTGVRGVGKTTTARLLARALNYQSETVDQPSVTDLAVDGVHCRAITEGRHLDVLELDAASHTGVGDMRDLLDGVRYAPVEGRYKVYIIDEVHMLSASAFNALLKTLEEPPPHATFIFATTEIRKVPVTILSRCQRFDLRRVEPEVIIGNLGAIAEAEGVRIEPEALTLIAHAAEGSVRDAQSLLDQAIVQVDGGQVVGAAMVQGMLGLADRAATIGVFEHVVRGDARAAIEAFRSLYGFGADPTTMMNDLLEHCHGASIAKALGPDVLILPSDQAARLAAIGAALSAGNLARIWQMLLKGHDEVRQAAAPAAAVEMALIRLAYVADLPGPEEALKALQGEGPAPGGGARTSAGGGGAAMARAPQAQAVSRTAPQAGLAPRSFEDVVRLIDNRRDVALLLDVEKYVRPISFRSGAIVFEPAPGAPANLSTRLAARLKEWTGLPWLVASEGGGGAETLLDRHKRERAAEMVEVLAEPFVQAVMTTFPGTEIIEVRQLVGAQSQMIPEMDPDED